MGIVSQERQKQQGGRLLLGIDEAGRGPLAGPVVVAGILYIGITKTIPCLGRIQDSKKLTAIQRERWYQILQTDQNFRFAVARIYPKTIDRINILRAARLGAWRVYQRLAPDGAAHALLDGSLILPPHISQETIIKGDEKIPLISAASIIAKVTRDRIMFRLHKKYPAYRFDLHKGYGTKLHRDMIQKFGRCELHRRSFRLIDK